MCKHFFVRFKPFQAVDACGPHATRGWGYVARGFSIQAREPQNPFAAVARIHVFDCQTAKRQAEATTLATRTISDFSEKTNIFSEKSNYVVMRLRWRPTCGASASTPTKRRLRRRSTFTPCRTPQARRSASASRSLHYAHTHCVDRIVSSKEIHPVELTGLWLATSSLPSQCRETFDAARHVMAGLSRPHAVTHQAGLSL